MKDKDLYKYAQKLRVSIIAFAIGLPIISQAQSSQSFEPAQARFAKEQLDLVEKTRLQKFADHRVDPVEDQILNAATSYYEWISKYGPQVDQLTEVFNNAAYKIDSIILGNEPIAGVTYTPYGSTEPKLFTYADLRDYLRWSREYAAKSPTLQVLEKGLDDPKSNMWGLTFADIQRTIVLLEKQINACAGEECVQIGLSAKEVDVHGVVINASIPLGVFKDLVNQGLDIKKSLLVTDPTKNDFAIYDITSLIESGSEFETTLTADIAALNPTFKNLPTIEPGRWNYFADSQIDKAVGTHKFSATNKSVFSLDDLLGKTPIAFHGQGIVLGRRYKVAYSPIRFYFEPQGDQLYIVYTEWENCTQIGEKNKMQVIYDGNNNSWLYRETCSGRDYTVRLKDGIPVERVHMGSYVDEIQDDGVLGTLSAERVDAKVPLNIRFCVNEAAVPYHCEDRQIYFEQQNDQLYIVYPRWETSNLTGEQNKMPVTVAGDNLFYRELPTDKDRRIVINAAGLPISYVGDSGRGIPIEIVTKPENESAKK